MNNIKARLRINAALIKSEPRPDDAASMLEAADRIERLERELAAVTEMRQHGCDCSDEDACRYARERDAARAENEALRKEAARMRGALEMLYPGLVLDLRYADADDDRDALQSRIDTVEEALLPIQVPAGECPYPIRQDHSIAACVEAGDCGCGERKP